MLVPANQPFESHAADRFVNCFLPGEFSRWTRVWAVGIDHGIQQILVQSSRNRSAAEIVLRAISVAESFESLDML